MHRDPRTAAGTVSPANQALAGRVARTTYDTASAELDRATGKLPIAGAPIATIIASEADIDAAIAALTRMKAAVAVAKSLPRAV